MLFALGCLALPRLAQSTTAGEPFDRSHALFTEVLQRHVVEGQVDYGGLAGDGTLDRYLAGLAVVSREEVEAWPEPDRIAFWVNAYNGFTLRLILDHRPVRSIRSIGFLPGSAFRKNFIHLRATGPEAVSLDVIEHGTLRKRFAEPRVHFALVCASRSCPPLRREAYRGADLDRQLDDATRGFLGDQRRNRLDVRSGALRLSPIFKWFREDFEREAGGVPAFVARYASEPLASGARRVDVEVEYESYDWSLNDAAVSPGSTVIDRP